MLFATLLILIILFENSSSFYGISHCFDRDSICAVLYCDEEINWPGLEKAGEDCIDPEEEMTGKYEEISFVPASDFSNDSATGKFVLELESKNDSIRRQKVTAQQLSHLMEHKIQFLVNGIWLEHDVDESLFPIVSIRNSTGNELEVLYLDCSLADINLQFLDLFDFTSSFVFWCYVAEGFCFVILIRIFIKNGTEDPKDILEILFRIFIISLGLSHISLIFHFLTTYFAVYLNIFFTLVWMSLLLSL
jgi:hypothetical protein